MDFALTPVQVAVQEKARGLARETKAAAARLDREGQFPREVLESGPGRGCSAWPCPRNWEAAVSIT